MDDFARAAFREQEAKRILRARALGLPDADPDGLGRLVDTERPVRHTGL